MAQTSLNSTGVASSGALSLQSNGTTEAIGISTGQVATLAQNPILTSGTANGVAYLNGSKVVTTGSALVFDGSNLGLGVTPSAWGSGSSAFQNSAGNIWRFGTDNIYFGQNYYFNGTNRIYSTSNAATEYQQGNGLHRWFNAASGTAGNAISFTQAMTLDASGNLGVGSTSPNLGGLTRALTINTPTGGNYSGVELAGAGTLSARFITNNAAGTFIGSQVSIPLIFETNATERARIDSSGNLIQSAPTTPPSLSTNGTMVFNLTSNTNLRVSVRGSDGVTRTANLTLA